MTLLYQKSFPEEIMWQTTSYAEFPLLLQHCNTLNQTVQSRRHRQIPSSGLQAESRQSDSNTHCVLHSVFSFWTDKNESDTDGFEIPRPPFLTYFHFLSRTLSIQQLTKFIKLKLSISQFQMVFWLRSVCLAIARLPHIPDWKFPADNAKHSAFILLCTLRVSSKPPDLLR